MNKLKTWIISIFLAGLSATYGIAQDKIHIMEYTGYDDLYYYSAFNKKYGKPKFTVMATAAEGLQKIKTGYKVDVAHPCSVDANDWILSGYIDPWDKSKLKNWDQYNKFWRDKAGFVQNDKIWIVPDEYYLTGLNVNTDAIDSKTIKSLDIFLDAKYKGKFAMPDEWSDGYSLAFAMLGLNKIADVTPENFDKASALLRKIVPNAKYLWSIGDTDVIPQISQKEIFFAWAWNSVAYAASNEGGKVLFMRDLGFSGSACGYVKMKGIKPELEQQAYDYVNAFTDQSNSVNFLEYSGYGHINDVGMKKLSKKSLEKSGVADLEKSLNKMFLWSDVEIKFREKAALEYEKIKAGH